MIAMNTTIVAIFVTLIFLTQPFLIPVILIEGALKMFLVPALFAGSQFLSIQYFSKVKVIYFPIALPSGWIVLYFE